MIFLNRIHELAVRQKNMKNRSFRSIPGLVRILCLLLSGSLLSCGDHGRNEKNSALSLKEQGSFSAGGAVIRYPGTYDSGSPVDPAGQTLHGDHAYVFYQIPVQARKYPLVFLHGAGQSSKTWETTPDGREGFRNMFLRRGFSTYLIDRPRMGRAGRSTVAGEAAAQPDEQFWFDTFRIGNWPERFPGVQFPDSPGALEQFFRQMTPNTGAYDKDVVASAVSALFDKIGEGILITHSQGGEPGWLAGIRNPKVKAIVAYEPGSGFIFPEGEVPAPQETTSPFGPLAASAVPLSDFLKLTRIPIVIYYGDNIASEPTRVWNKDHWRIRMQMARLWVDAVNRHGGNAVLVHLPSIGIRGNTHFPFSDRNNLQIADLLSEFLNNNRLD